MTKFIKRLKKTIGTTDNALVIGSAFGYFDQIPKIFKTVFVHSDSLDLKGRNIVYIKSLQDIELSNSVDIVFVDLQYIKHIENIMGILTRQSPFLVIEGNDVIERPRVECLYKTGFRAVEKLGIFHLWKKIK
jgi:hypothetical protein